MEEYSDVRAYLEKTRKKRKRLSRMKNALAEHLFQIENLRGVAITERVQSSNTTTIDAMLESVEEEKERVDELEKEVEAISLKAKKIIDVIKDMDIVWLILRWRFIDGECWDDIANTIYYSKASVKRKCNEGVEKIQQRLSHSEPQ